MISGPKEEEEHGHLALSRLHIKQGKEIDGPWSIRIWQQSPKHHQNLGYLTHHSSTPLNHKYHDMTWPSMGDGFSYSG
jgi:hypothetical protein